MPKMRYDCDTQGCFNKKIRPKIEKFDDCFPGKIAFGDVDGFVEINHRFLYLEWKTAKGIQQGQHIANLRRTERGESCVLVVVGDAETMDVKYMGMYSRRVWSDWKAATFDDVHQRISKWALWAKGQPAGANRPLEPRPRPIPALNLGSSLAA
jgi:phosphoribosyl-AMP cyclohydrolase